MRVAFNEQAQIDAPLQRDDATALAAASTADTTIAVEQALMRQQLIALLHEKLPNPLERLVILRIVLFGDHPRDVARDLGLPLHRARTAKSRALHKLRADAQLLQLLRD